MNAGRGVPQSAVDEMERAALRADELQRENDALREALREARDDAADDAARLYWLCVDLPIRAEIVDGLTTDGVTVFDAIDAAMRRADERTAGAA